MIGGGGVVCLCVWMCVCGGGGGVVTQGKFIGIVRFIIIEIQSAPHENKWVGKIKTFIYKENNKHSKI